MIQRMKERLASEATKVEQLRRSCAAASPAKMIQSQAHFTVSTTSNIENGQSPGRAASTIMYTSPLALAGKAMVCPSETVLNFGADQNKRARKD